MGLSLPNQTANGAIGLHHLAGQRPPPARRPGKQLLTEHRPEGLRELKTDLPLPSVTERPHNAVDGVGG